MRGSNRMKRMKEKMTIEMDDRPEWLLMCYHSWAEFGALEPGMALRVACGKGGRTHVRIDPGPSDHQETAGVCEVVFPMTSSEGL